MMMNRYFSPKRLLRIAGIVGLTFLTACSGNDNSDLVEFMETERAKPGAAIKPLPAFAPYTAVIYSAAGMRSPFNPPQEVVESELLGTETAAPNRSRPKEPLERFNIAELRMVGTIEQAGIRWALINDGKGSVHRVKNGNYVGRNFGRIREVRPTGVDLVEVVVNGQGGWIERPRSLNMANQ